VQYYRFVGWKLTPPVTAKLSKNFKIGQLRRWAKFGSLSLYLARLCSYSSKFSDICRHPTWTCLQSGPKSWVNGLKRPPPQMVKLATLCDIAQSDYCDAGPCLAWYTWAIYTGISVIFLGSIESSTRPEIEGVVGKCPHHKRSNLLGRTISRNFKRSKLVFRRNMFFSRFRPFKHVWAYFVVENFFFGFTMTLGRT